jgi:hypothetical protein
MQLNINPTFPTTYVKNLYQNGSQSETDCDLFLDSRKMPSSSLSKFSLSTKRTFMGDSMQEKLYNLVYTLPISFYLLFKVIHIS